MVRKLIKELNGRNFPAVAAILEGSPFEARGSIEGGVTPLHVAASIDDPDFTRVILKFRPNVEARCSDGGLLGHLAVTAVASQRLKIDTRLSVPIRNCAEIPVSIVVADGFICCWRPLFQMANAPVGTGITPLHIAAAKGHEQVVKLLLQARALPDEVAVDGSTALHFACANKHMEVVRMLLAAGASASVRNVYDTTPLHIACASCSEEIVEELLAKCADTDQSTNDGMSPLTFASAAGAEKVVALLLRKIKKRTPIETRLSLLIAASNGHVGVLKLLLDTVDAESSSGPWLSEALTAAIHADECKAARSMLRRSRKPTIDVGALHRAVIRGSAAMVTLLRSHKAHLNADEDGRNSLWYACEYSHGDIALELLQNGAKVLPARDGQPSSFWLACRENMLDVVKKSLRKIGAKTLKEELAHSLLQLVCRRGHVVLLRELLSTIERLGLTVREEVDSQDKEGRTALHFAAYNGHVEVVDLLIDRGAQLLADNKGRTAINVAIGAGHTSLAKRVLDRFSASMSTEMHSRSSSVIEEAIGSLALAPVCVHHFRELGASDYESDTNTKRGSGKFGAVYEANWIGNEPPVNPIVVKIMNVGGNTSNERVAEREINVIERIGTTEHHALFAIYHGYRRVLDSNGAVSEVHIVMERALRSLTEYFEELFSTFPRDSDCAITLELVRKELPTLSRVMLSVADATSVLHSIGIAHFDLCPNNILLMGRENGVPATVCDFGLCDAPKPNEPMRGTQNFIAPELRRAVSADVSVAVDVYSFGCVMWQWLRGGCKVPKHDATLCAVDEPFPQVYSPSSLSTSPLSAPHQELVDLTSRCLDPEPKNRPTIEEVAHELRKVNHALDS